MYYGDLNAADFEHLVLQQYRRAFKKNEKWTKILLYKSPATRRSKDIPPLYREREARCCGNGTWWWEPPKESIAADYCIDSSMHGLRYVAQPKRHLSERIFWAVIFVLSVVAAALLINDVWTRYYNNPVIVTFMPKEVGIDGIPFPAVTICNMNAFPKSGLDKRLQILEDAKIGKATKEEEQLAREDIKIIYAACTAQHSFAKKNKFAYTRGKIDPSLTDGEISDDDKGEMIEFLYDNTIPCDKFIRYCVWAGEVKDCKEFFKPIVTDYGKLQSSPGKPPFAPVHSHYNKLRKRTSSRKKGPYVPRWSVNETNLWKEWDYINHGFNLQDHIQQPRRQNRAGLHNGLSILIDPDITDNFCPMSDSEGVKVTMHPSLELPHVQDVGTIIGLGQEVYLEIHPEVTMADDDIENFPIKDRKCLFSDENSLDFYRPYAASNCMDECVSKMLLKRCNCTQYFMPRLPTTEICNFDYRSADNQCIQKAKEHLVDAIKEDCSYCLPPCEDITFNFELTGSTLHDGKSLWGDPKNKSAIPLWKDNKLSVLHIYMGTDSVVPKVRKSLYGTTDLIASTGGLLGLCLGFSVMSLVEILYFATLRAFWQYKKKKDIVKGLANKFIGFIWKSRNKGTRKIGIDMERNHAIFHPNYTNAYGFPPTTINQKQQNIYTNFRF